MALQMEETESKQQAEENKYQEIIETSKRNIETTDEKDLDCKKGVWNGWITPKFSEANEDETVDVILIRIEIREKDYRKFILMPQLFIDDQSTPMIHVKSRSNSHAFIYRFLIRKEKVSEEAEPPKHIRLRVLDRFKFDKKYANIQFTTSDENQLQQIKTFMKEENSISLIIYQEEIVIHGTLQPKSRIKEDESDRYHQFPKEDDSKQLSDVESDKYYQFPNKEQCDIYSGILDKDEWVKAYNKGKDEEGAINIFLCKRERKMQIYYDERQNMVYGIYNRRVKQSKVFGGDDYEYDMKKKKRILYRYLQRKSGNGRKLIPLYEVDNISESIWISARYQWIENECLYGQDNEFNIFRSLCFIRFDEPIMSRLSIGVIVLVLQLFLTTGIVMEVFINWDSDEMFDNDVLIMIISVLVFTIISFMYTFTVTKYFEFYDHMRYVTKISWFIVALDFISNIFIGFIICFISSFFLIQSETITDVVLNSFALTFIIELDDMANLYEADEDKLMEADWNNLRGGNYDDSIRKIKVNNSFPPLLTISSTMALIFVAPFSIIYAFILICYQFIIYCRKREKKLYQTVVDKME